MFSLKKKTLDIEAVHLLGERIVLRPPKLSDHMQWKSVRERDQDYLQEFEPLWPAGCLGKEFFEKRLLRQYKLWNAGLGRSFLIFERDSDTLVGGMNINNIARGAAQYASLGYWLARDAQGQGYMAEALALILSYCFGPLKLHRVHASCVPHNERSRKCLIRAGFLEEGFAKHYLEINGQWQDHVLYGLPLEAYLQELGNADQSPREASKNERQKHGG